MQINLKEYKEGKSLELKNQEFILSKSEFDFNKGEDFNILDDIIVKGDISVLDDLLRINFNISLKFEFVCSRCLKNFAYNFNLDCNDEISLNDLNEEIVIDSDQNLIFTDYIKNCIIVSIPQKKLCNVDCLGLCQKCGINLNDKMCDCHDNGIDNAFAQLRGFFVDSKEV